MNKPIFDLLDSYEDDSVELGDAAPLSSARIKELTMNNITNKTNKRTLRRAPLRLLAAAAAAAALVVSAVAVATNALGAGDLMQSLFRRWSPEPLTATQVEILNGMGHVFDGSDTYSVTSNGATITPISAMADEDCYYLHLRVEAPEGVVLPDLEERSWYSFLRIDLETEAENSEPKLGGRLSRACFALPDDDPTDNIKDIVLRLEGTMGEDIRFNDGSPKRLTFYGLGIASMSDSGDFTRTELFQGEFRFDIGAHFISQVATIDCGGALWTDPETGVSNYMDTIKLSPLGLGFYFRTNLRWDNNVRRLVSVPGDVRVVMKDGSELFVRYDCGYIMDKRHPDVNDPYYQIVPDMLTQELERRDSYYHSFYTPLDLSQVDYVQFGEDYIYPIRTE